MELDYDLNLENLWICGGVLGLAEWGRRKRRDKLLGLANMILCYVMLLVEWK